MEADWPPLFLLNGDKNKESNYHHQLIIFKALANNDNSDMALALTYRAGCRSYVTGSIHGCSRSHLTYIPGGC